MVQVKEHRYTNISTSATTYKQLGILDDFGIPQGATVVGMYIKGWDGITSHTTLKFGSSGRDLYIVTSNNTVGGILNICISYIP